MTKTAVIYARYSSENQTEQSIEGQLRVCKEYAKRNNILILNTYIDRAMTGTNDNRADFQRMMKDSTQKRFDYVLVYKLDRFSRNKYEMAIHKKTLRDNGAKVLSATEFIPDSPEGIIFESMLEGYAEYYSAELSQKVRRGMNETRLKGNYTGGFIIYGYKVVDKKIQIEESEAEIVKWIFEKFAAGVYVRNIIAELHAKGISNRGKPFKPYVIYCMLKNEKYIGIYRHKTQIYENMYPAILPKELFERVRKITKQNHHGTRSVKTVYLLRHKIKCGYCGVSICAECGTSKNGTSVHYYKCFGRKRGNGCTKAMIRQEFLEKLILDEIVKQLNQEKLRNILIATLMEYQKEIAGKNIVLAALQKEKKQVDTALKNLVSAVERGIISNSTNKRLHELEEQQMELERNILIEQSKVAIQCTEEEIRKFYEQALRLEPQALINYLVKEIVLYDDKVEIHYNSPIQSGSPDESRGCCFFTTTGILYYTSKMQGRNRRISLKIEFVV